MIHSIYYYTMFDVQQSIFLFVISCYYMANKQYDTQYNAMQYNAMQYNTIQYNTIENADHLPCWWREAATAETASRNIHRDDHCIVSIQVTRGKCEQIRPPGDI